MAYVTEEKTERRAPVVEGGVTARAVITGIVLLLIFSVVAFYVTLLEFTISSFGTGVPAAGPYAVLFLLAGALTVPRLRRLLRFSRNELLTIFAIVLMGAPLVSQSILGWMIPHTIFQRYLARAIPDWRNTFIPLLPTWFSPTDPGAIESFFQGRAAVPWSLWAVPLLAWCSFLVGIVVASVSLTLLVQRQWITNERLSFPLAQIPLETVARAGSDSERAAGRLALGWMFWAGLLISFSIGFYNSLALWVPALPSIPVGPVTIVRWQPVGPFAAVGDVDLVLWPWLIALTYLIPKELSFSSWFFWWFRVALTVIAIAAGAFPERTEEWWGNTFPAPYWQGVGAVIALGLWTLWIGRKHLVHAFRIAFSRASGTVDSDEPLPYRWSLLAFAASFAYLVYFCWLAGSRVTVGIALVSLILVFYLTWARLRAETGMGFLSFPLKADSVMLGTLGNVIYRPREIISIISLRWAYFPGYGQSPEVFCGNALESMKIADSAAIPKRALLWAIMGGFLVALVFGVYIVMTGFYHYGLQGLRAETTTTEWWLDQQLTGDGTRIFNELQNPSHFELNTTLALAAGGLFAIFLGLMRQRFWWWPFHPIGYLAANTWAAKWNWMPFLVGWLAKVIVIRYGGLRLFRRTVPLAIGLIAGDLLNQVVWGLLQAVARSHGLG